MYETNKWDIGTQNKKEAKEEFTKQLTSMYKIFYLMKWKV